MMNDQKIYRCDVEGDRDEVKLLFCEYIAKLGRRDYIGQVFPYFCKITNGSSEYRFTAYVVERMDRHQCTGQEVRILLEECGFRSWKENPETKIKMEVTNETIIREKGSIKLGRTTDKSWLLIIIIDGGDNKMPFNYFGKSSYEWQPIFERGHLKEAYIFMKNVYLKSATCWYFLRWLLEAGAIIIAPECTIGTKVIGIISEAIDEQKEIGGSFGDGKCCFTEIIVGGLSGYGLSDKINTWFKMRKPTSKQMKLYSDIMK